MRYGIWDVFISNNEAGLTPLNVNGAFYIDDTEKKIAGYLGDDVVTNTEPWNIQEISADDFLQLLLTKNPQGKLIDGIAVVPPIGVIK